METVIWAVMFSLWGYDARVHLDSVPSFTYEDVSQGFQLLVEAQAYLKVFNFLWKLKRVNHSLTGVWKVEPNCIVSSPFYMEGTSIGAQFVSVLFNEMNHFVTMEVSWARFLDY